ncbi:MAG: RNA-guided pseudouridylation complex pseudouridine synthase subunit Cbf5 [Candidatus Aenigmatarchaeota archaeon]
MKEFLVKSNDIAIMEYGKYPGSRSVEELIKNGLVILDKWCGPTSHDVSATVKKIFGLSRAGHSGTLDPGVSGILPITLENACKVIPALQKLDKEYVGIMHLHKDVSDSELAKVIKKFTGEIRQTPPRRSAVARKERTRKVHSFEMLERKGKDVLFRVSCEAGTYIRVICHQIGRETGGAHMSELRRTRVGRFDESMSVKIQDLVDSYEFWKSSGDERIREYVLPVEAAIEHTGKIIVKDSAIATIVDGSPLYSQGISRIEKGIEKEDLVALLSLKGELIALAKSNMTSEEMMKRSGLAAKTDRVIIQKGIYPKMK